MNNIMLFKNQKTNDNQEEFFQIWFELKKIGDFSISQRTSHFQPYKKYCYARLDARLNGFEVIIKSNDCENPLQAIKDLHNKVKLLSN